MAIQTKSKSCAHRCDTCKEVECSFVARRRPYTNRMGILERILREGDKRRIASAIAVIERFGEGLQVSDIVKVYGR